MHKKIIQLLAILVLAPLAFSALAQPARFVEGTHYVVLPAFLRCSGMVAATASALSP